MAEGKPFQRRGKTFHLQQEPWIHDKWADRSRVGIFLTLAVVPLCFFAALYSILATSVTSAMTKNMWKNMRGIVVWVVGLSMFYVASGNNNLGEEWEMPGSLLILGGSAVLMVGVHVYYHKKPEPETSDIPESDGDVETAE